MKKVHVVFKTHLDLGFTDFASNVLDNYNQNYIPRAVELAFELNQESSKPKFIWTTGSYLIWQYLKTQPQEQTQRLIEAIELGYIAWHAMPVTYHSEAAGKLVLEQALNITNQLDAQFNRKTIAAKMTDVPGHTKAIVPILEANGIEFLHIGMNGVSALPDVPENFIWDCNGKQLIVAYSTDYGTEVEINGCDDILVFAHTHDNSGPQSKERILKQLSSLEERFPDYEVCASTLDNYVHVLNNSTIDLPIVTEEIGDTWIHGIASDPQKMRDYNILIELTKKWITQNKILVSDNQFTAFINNLMLVPEHTWGMDIKRYFSDYLNYSKEDFNKARKEDKINDQSLTFRYQEIGIATAPEMKYTSFEWDQRTYSRYEKSWKEQRLYIEQAIECLPSELASEAKLALEPNRFIKHGTKLEVYKPISINGYNLQVNEHGAICKLEKDGIDYATDTNQLFKLQYTIVGNDSYEALRTNYLRDLDKHFWAVDFLKPGIELQSEIINTQTFDVFVSNISCNNNQIIIDLYTNHQAIEKFGAPREMQIIYTVDQKITVDILLSNKDAIRYPEIISLGIKPLVNNLGRYKIQKLGLDINPLDIVGNGSKIVHGLDNKISYDGIDRKFSINAIDSRIVSIGQVDNLKYNRYYSNLQDGYYFHLLNTTWGTNFTMWYEEDISAKFEFEILGK